jgi:hypothetical protein
MTHTEREHGGIEQARVIVASVRALHYRRHTPGALRVDAVWNEEGS